MVLTAAPVMRGMIHVTVRPAKVKGCVDRDHAPAL
jgi:hypothetical protein